jgi:imidazolonepropionase-like amidohydrolase
MPSIVFRGTVVLPAELLPQGVVVVEIERIVAVGRASDVMLPAGARTIDARQP